MVAGLRGVALRISGGFGFGFEIRESTFPTSFAHRALDRYTLRTYAKMHVSCMEKRANSRGAFSRRLLISAGAMLR